MERIEFYKLRAQEDQRAHQIQNLNDSINGNQRKINQLSEDRRTALRSKDQAAANDAQFSLDALALENTDLKAKIKTLQSVRLDRAEADKAWKADLTDNPAYRQELALYSAAAALYDAVCVRAKEHYRDWESFAEALTTMIQGDSFPPIYAAPDPSGELSVQGLLYATPSEFGENETACTALNPDAIDGLIDLLQQIKANGVSAIM